MKYLNLFFIVLILTGCNKDNKSKDVRAEVKKTDKISSSNPEPTELKVGEYIDLSEYSLRPNNGQQLDSKKLILVDFWATWCAPCIMAFPHLEDVQKEFQNELQVVAISDEKRQKVSDFLKKKPFDLSFFTNEDGSLFEKFDITTRPTSILISDSGEFLWIGRSEGVEKIIQSYLETDKIRPRREDLNYFNSYYNDEKTNKSNKDQESLISYQIQNSKDTIFKASNYHQLRDLPAKIQYEYNTLPEIIQDLLLVSSTRLINNRADLEKRYLDINVRSNIITNEIAVNRVLEDLQKIYQFQINKETIPTDVLFLKIEDKNMLNSFEEKTEGGGMFKKDNDSLNAIRVGLDFIASVSEKKIKPGFIIYDGNDARKFSFKIKDPRNLDELKVELKTIGLSLEPGIKNLEFTYIN